jgi:signal transduction histidine kinase
VPVSRHTPTVSQVRPRPQTGISADESADFAAWLQRVRESERAALARELHDELGAILTAARLDAAWLAAQPGCQDPRITQRLDALQRLLAQGIGLKRRIIEDLHPTVLTHLGLVAAIEQLVASHRERFAGRIETELDSSAGLQGEAALALYRIAQEALTNVQKYAHAGMVRVVLERTHGRIQLRVLDDGRGFEPNAVGCGHHGLAGMRQRMRALGGRVEVTSAPGAGTRVVASLEAPPSKTRGPRESAPIPITQRSRHPVRHHGTPAQHADAPLLHS